MESLLGTEQVQSSKTIGEALGLHLWCPVTSFVAILSNFLSNKLNEALD